jgi:SEC-C motif-containing protein
MVNCPCGSEKNYSFCCEPYITGKQCPDNPEALMRARYTAYTMANIDFIKDTMRGKALIGFQETEAKRWAARVKWIKLQVFHSTVENLNTGYVAFEASFVDGARLKSMHEKSTFIREDGRWYYVSGTHLPTTHPEKMIPRNANCPCGSLRKFKNCHGGG